MKFYSSLKLAVCAGCLVVSSAQADIRNTFTDRADWEAAVGSGDFVTEEFDVPADRKLANNTLEDVGKFSVFYTTLGGVDEERNRVINETGSSDGRVGDYLQLVWETNGVRSTESVELHFDSPINAFAANFLEIDFDDGLFLKLDGTTVDLSTALNSRDNVNFLGWTLDNPVSSISFSGPGAGDVTFLLDNVSISAVPVPAAVWLFGSALLGLLGFRRKG